MGVGALAKPQSQYAPPPPPRNSYAAPSEQQSYAAPPPAEERQYSEPQPSYGQVRKESMKKNYNPRDGGVSGFII